MLSSEEVTAARDTHRARAEELGLMLDEVGPSAKREVAVATAGSGRKVRSPVS